MTFPEWTKPSIYGAVFGAIAVIFLGFSSGGWITSSKAEKMANTLATDEVTLAMVPVCLNMSALDPKRAEKLATLQGVSGYTRSQAGTLQKPVSRGLNWMDRNSELMPHLPQTNCGTHMSADLQTIMAHIVVSICALFLFAMPAFA